VQVGLTEEAYPALEVNNATLMPFVRIIDFGILFPVVKQMIKVGAVQFRAI
jgi:hypothetical protein